MIKHIDYHCITTPNIVWLEGKLRNVHLSHPYSILSTFVDKMCVNLSKSSHL